MTAPLRITVPMQQVDRFFLGDYLTGAEGDVCGLPVVISLTHLELHIAFTHVDAPAVAINLMDITYEATAALAVALFGGERRKP